MTVLGLLPTLFPAYVCSPLYSASTAVEGSVGFFLEESALRHFISMSGYIHDTFCLPHIFKRITGVGVNDVLFQFAKATTASPHITQEYQTQRLLNSKMLNPRRRPGRSGPNYYLPSPRRAFLPSLSYHRTGEKSRTYAVNIVYNGLPVHAVAQTDKPLFAQNRRRRATLSSSPSSIFSLFARQGNRQWVLDQVSHKARSNYLMLSSSFKYQ